MTVYVQVLGAYVAVRDGVPIPDAAYGGRLPRWLARFLATRMEHAATQAAIADALWGAEQPADPAANVAVLVNRLRGAIGDTAVVTMDGGYRLGGDVIVDADRFATFIADGHAAAGSRRPLDAFAAYRAALALWRGSPGEDVDAWWAAEANTRWRQARLDALLGVSEAALDLGNPAAALSCAREALGEDPLRESAHLLIVRARAAGGDRAGALEDWQAMRSTFAEELGIEPSAAAHAVQRAILLPETGMAPAAADVSRRDEAPFVGRADALAVLVTAARLPQIAVVLGAPGTGKSRLLAEGSALTAREVVTARARLAERDSDWGVVRHLMTAAVTRHPGAVDAVSSRALPALADLVPRVAELRAVAPSVMDDRARRALLWGAVGDVLDALPPDFAVAVDDWQWADDSSVEAIGGWLARRPSVPVVLAARPADSDANPSAMVLLDRLRDVSVVSIGALLPDDWEGIVDGELRDALLAATGGTPLEVLEVLRSLEDRGAIVRRSDGRCLPARPTAVAEARAEALSGRRRRIDSLLAQLPPSQLQLMAVLSVLERPMPAAGLAPPLGRPADQLGADLRALADIGLARHGGRGWEPAHDLVGEAVREVLPATDRERAHAAVARTAGDPADRAAHLAQAHDPGAAAAYLEAAQDRARRAATAEAQRLASAGLALEPLDRIRAELLAVRGNARAATGDIVGGRTDLREALSLTTDAPARAHLLVRQALLHFGADDLRYAAELLAMALAAAGDVATARAPALALTAMCEANLGDFAHAEKLSAEALRIYTRVGDTRGMAEVADDRAMAVFLEGRLDEAIEDFDRAARLLTDVGDLTRAMMPRATRGHALALASRPAEGLVDTDTAIELAVALGNKDGECFARMMRCYALTALGRVDEALVEGGLACAIAGSLGHRGWSALAWHNLGMARDAAGDVSGAETAFRTAAVDGKPVPLFAGLANVGIASVRWQQGAHDEARVLLAEALTGPPLVVVEAVALAARFHIGDDPTFATS